MREATTNSPLPLPCPNTRSRHPMTAIIDARTGQRSLSITFSDGYTREFDYVWLRDNATEARHPNGQMGKCLRFDPNRFDNHPVKIEDQDIKLRQLL